VIIPPKTSATTAMQITTSARVNAAPDRLQRRFLSKTGMRTWDYIYFFLLFVNPVQQASYHQHMGSSTNIALNWPGRPPQPSVSPPENRKVEVLSNVSVHAFFNRQDKGPVPFTRAKPDRQPVEGLPLSCHCSKTGQKCSQLKPVHNLQILREIGLVQEPCSRIHKNAIESLCAGPHGIGRGHYAVGCSSGVS